jgi:hypothetical protein
LLFRFRASSVLQKNVKVYGPAHALDTENSSSCWNSEGNQGDTHWLTIDFGGRTVCIKQVKIMFQAGFAAESGLLQVQVQLPLPTPTPTPTSTDGSSTSPPGNWETAQELEFEDTYELQTESTITDNGTNGYTTKAVKFIFQDFTDFYGRVTIYRLEIWRNEV